MKAVPVIMEALVITYVMLLKCGALLLTHFAMLPYCFYGELPYCNIVMQDLGTCVHWICISLMNLIGVFG